jgi:hypothetical protein
MNYYDQLMLEYYRVLNNAWKTEIKDAARLAIQMLSDMPRAEKINKYSIDKLMGIINTQLGDDFAALVNEPTKAIIDRCVRLGLKDTQVQAPTKTSIGLWGIEDQHLSSTIQKQLCSGSVTTLKLMSGRTSQTPSPKLSSKAIPKRCLPILSKTSSMTWPIDQPITGRDWQSIQP